MNSVPIVNFAGKSKYIARKYSSVYEHVENGSVILTWIGTDDMIADVLTKAILGNKSRNSRSTLWDTQLPMESPKITTSSR